MSKEVSLQFVWSDDLARLLVDEGEAMPADLLHWTGSLVGHRLPDDLTPLEFARRLRHEEFPPAEPVAC